MIKLNHIANDAGGYHLLRFHVLYFKYEKFTKCFNYKRKSNDFVAS
jgi:hypothetical protein